MHISHLQLTQFRNYSSLDIEFCPGINCLIGPNGVGKTNVLDAIHYLAFTRGFRNTQDKQAIQHGNQFFFNGGTLIHKKISQQINCNFVIGKGKKILINQKPITKMSEHIGRIPLVAVLPYDTELIYGPSAGRRKFLDILISQYDQAYLNHLIQYSNILAQRNALLKMFAENRRFDPLQLEVWDEQLIPHGIGILEGRRQFIAEFWPIFQTYFKQIVSESEIPDIQYRSQIEENTHEGWQRVLKGALEKDRVNLYSGSGIHRDDLIFKINTQSVRNFGSQGQQKTFVIALKLAQYQLLEKQTGLHPLLLLDDIFDKLDEDRLTRISQILDQEIQGQTFITDTSYDRLGDVFAQITDTELAFFKVSPGEVEVLE